MIEEGLYDNEPTYIRATLYERVLGVPPIAGFEVHDTLADLEKIRGWIDSNGFELFHSKYVEYGDDGEERMILYFVNRPKKAMIMIRRKYTNPDRGPEILSSEDGPMEKDTNRNPNKIDWFSYYCASENEARAFQKTFDDFRMEEDTKNKIYMLKSTEYNGLELDSFPMVHGDMPLELNYGSAFLPTHEHIVDCLKNKKSGLYVLHGPPGTGKTSYIKHLTTVVGERKFIFVPNIMVAELFSPKMVSKLYTFKDSALVLEDAEVCVFKRDGTNNALVSGILNITDGLLKDLLNIAILVTFNATDVKELDDALLRKGRLKVMHKFGLLSLADAKKLATHLGKKKPVTTELSLADVYNLDENTGIEEVAEKKFGFGG